MGDKECLRESESADFSRSKSAIAAVAVAAALRWGRAWGVGRSGCVGVTKIDGSC